HRADEEGSLPSGRLLHSLRCELGRARGQGQRADRDPHLRPGGARAAGEAVHEDHLARAGGSVMHVRKGDQVVVIAGKEKGKRGRVLRLLTDKGRVVIERVNMVKRHTKPTQRQPRGGILEKEGSVEASNVALWCGKCVAPRRAKTEEKEGQKKRRVCVKCGTVFETS